MKSHSAVKRPCVFKRSFAFLVSCILFVLLFAMPGFAAESNNAAVKNPNDTHFPITVSGKTSREVFREGVYQRFADESMVTYLVVMHKKGDLAGDSFERTYIGIESVQRNHPGGKPDGSVFMAARLRSPREVKRYLGMQGNPPVINDNELPFLLDFAETVRNGRKGMLKNQPKMYIMLSGGEGSIDIIGGPDDLPAPIMGHYVPVTDRPAPLVLQQAMIKCMLEDFIPAATNMLTTSQFYDYKIEFRTGDNPPVDSWAGWYQVTVWEDRNMKEYDSRYQMNFIVGDTGNEIKLLTLYDGKLWPVYEDNRLKDKKELRPQVEPKG